MSNDMTSRTNRSQRDDDRGDMRSRVEASLAVRYRREKRFRVYGLLSVVIGIAFLGFLFSTVIGNGYSAFWQTHVRLEVTLDPEVIDPDGQRDRQALSSANYTRLVRNAMQQVFPGVQDRRDRRALGSLVSQGASFELRLRVLEDPTLIGQTIDIWVPTDDEVDMLVKGHVDSVADGSNSRLNEQQINWVDELRAKGLIEKKFNTAFFTSGDSREPELAGIWGATKGSFFMLLVTLLLSFPLGWPRPSTSRSLRQKIAGSISSRSTSTISRQFHRLFMVCWDWQCSST